MPSLRLLDPVLYFVNGRYSTFTCNNVIDQDSRRTINKMHEYAFGLTHFLNIRSKVKFR